MSPNKWCLLVLSMSFILTMTLISFVMHVHDVAIWVGSACPVILWSLFAWKVARITDRENANLAEHARQARQVRDEAEQAARAAEQAQTMSGCKIQGLVS